MAIGSSLQEGGSRRPAPSPWPQIPPQSRTSTPSGPSGRSSASPAQSTGWDVGAPLLPLRKQGGIPGAMGQLGAPRWMRVLAAPALKREGKAVAEMPASTGCTLLASRRPRRHGRHGDSCLGHLSSPAEAPLSPRCPEDPHDEMWKRGDSSTGGELCPGSPLRSALEDRSGGPRCSSWPRRDPDRGLTTCPPLPRPRWIQPPTSAALGSCQKV